ncbi:MAG: D-inositol-3-phosphate glycosyltransferase, partial [Actinomycetota bacterium]|nr:D-inositol-3-phosphate glycosyltransferase [Actinomycetota bacterium]
MRVSVVVSGLGNSTQRLQPWRYLTEMAMGLAALGHEIEILTDGPTELELTGVRLWSARSERAGASNLRVNDRLRTNRPDIVLWNCGTTSALRAGPLRLPGTRNVAVFTSPLHEPAELARLGRAVIRQPSSYLALGLGSLIPRRYLARWLAASFDQIVFLGASTAAQLAVAGLPAGRSVVIPPGRDVDLQPAEPLTVDRVGLRGRVSFVFAGSPAPIRGADLLVRAFAGARTH